MAKDDELIPVYSPGIQKRMKNLKPWKKGECGNPNWLQGPRGVPNKPITEAYNRLLQMEVPEDMRVGQFEKLKGVDGITFADVLALSNMLRAVYLGKGGIAAAKEITDRTEGRPDMNVNVSGMITHTMSDEDRRRRILELASRREDDSEEEELPTIDAEIIDDPDHVG